MREKRTALIILLILLSLLLFVPQIGVVKAEGIIYILSDGSVEGTDKIQRNDDVYVLTGNLSAGIQVQKSNIVIDGAGYTIQGNGSGTGINISNRTRVTVQNVRIKNFETGIAYCARARDFGCFSSKNIIVGNEVTNNTFSGILIYGGLNNNITGNYVAENGKGVYIKDGSYNFLGSNNFRNNRCGISLYNAPNNTIIENHIENNTVGLSVSAIAYVSSSCNIIINNNFINNAEQVTLDVLFAPKIINIWDNGSEGNYWSNYNGTDYNINGIGDTPYVIDADNQDNYPLMEPTFILEFLLALILVLILVGSLAIVLFKKKVRRQL